MAFNITFFTTFSIQEFYVLVIKRDYFKQFQAKLFAPESFQDWPPLIKLAIPTTFLNCIEWWAFEFVIIFAGIIGVTALSA